MIISNRDWKYI